MPEKLSLCPVGQVATVCKIKTQNGVAGLDDRHVSRGIRLGTRVRLHICVLRAKKLFCAVARQIFNDIGKFATTVVAFSRIAFGILVGKHGTHSLEHRLADKVLRGDHFETIVLAANFVVKSGGDLWISLGERTAHAVRHGLILAYVPEGNPAGRLSRNKLFWLSRRGGQCR